MERKIAIIKNGYDILRIREINSDEEKCEFKICIMAEQKNVKILYNKLFSEKKEIEFDKDEYYEITYHKATISQPPKIHIKFPKSNDKKYITLPLKNLIEPDIHTEIPIPLFKITIPDKCLTVKYKPKKAHKIIDIENNNCIDIYMKKSGVQIDYDKWFNIGMMLRLNAFEFNATNSLRYMGKNLQTIFYKMNHEVCKLSVATDISDDVGISINEIKDNDINHEKIEILFIENSLYLAFVGLSRKSHDGITEFCYKLDIKSFNEDEQKKWEYRFKKLENKLNVNLKRYSERIRQMNIRDINIMKK